MTTTIDPQNSDLDSAPDQLDIARFSRALAEAERARIASRKRRARGVVAGLVATVLAGTGLVIGQVQHQGHVARDARIAEISANTAAEEAFLREAFEAARRDRLAATLAEQAARRGAANDAISASVAGAQERLLNSEGKVLDGSGRDALAAAIAQATAVRDTEGGSIWEVEAQTGLIDATSAQVDSDVAAWEAEQARIAAEAEAARVAAEAARRAAESAKPAAVPAPKSQTQTKQSAGTSVPSAAKSTPAPAAPVQNSGEYRTTAASGYGLSVAYVDEGANCGGSGSTGSRFWVTGCYPGSGSTIYISTSALSADSAAKRRIVDGVAQHEAAHFLITQKCGSVNPAIAGGRFEQVTDAYTALYVGGGTGGYGYNNSDAEIARSINAGVCS